jgi:hypothetical protein
MAETASERLSDLIAPTKRLALVGLAKNTGKTETLAAVLRELADLDACVGVTSIGRDGEQRDVIDARIEKPRIVLQAGSLVASTDALVRASGLAHERLAQTGMRTPLGEVVIARLAERGAIEVAGPSTGEDLSKVSEAMLGFGAERVLIDGSIDRRSASSPAVADGLVIATGAVLSEDIDAVVSATKDAVDLVGLPKAGEGVAQGSTGEASEVPSAGDARTGASNDETQISPERRLVLNADPAEIATLLGEHPDANTLLIDGALGERFLEGLLAARAARAGRELKIVVRDPTKVFLTQHGPDWYRCQGLAIEVRQTIDLKAITVNPVAPQSHRFDSKRLRELIGAAIADVPVLDVRDPAYLATSAR